MRIIGNGATITTSSSRQEGSPKNWISNIVRSTMIASCDPTLEFHAHPLPLNVEITTLISLIPYSYQPHTLNEILHSFTVFKISYKPSPNWIKPIQHVTVACKIIPRGRLSCLFCSCAKQASLVRINTRELHKWPTKNHFLSFDNSCVV